MAIDGSAPRAASADDLVAATPASRDRFVDAVRVLALGGVILGHYVMGVVTWAPGTPVSKRRV